MDFYERLRNGLFGFFGGPNDQRLTPSQNQQAGQTGLVNAGLATILEANRPGIQPYAAGAMAGRQAGAAERSALQQQNVQAQMANAFNTGEMDPALLEKIFMTAIVGGDYEAARQISPILSATVASRAREPAVTRMNERHVDLENDKGDVEQWRIVTDPTTGKEVSREKVGLVRSFRDEPSSAEIVDRRTQFETANEGALSANRTLSALNYLEQIANNPNVSQGPFAIIPNTFKQVFESLTGISLPGTEEVQVMDAMSNMLALMLRNPASGMGLPGNTSDADLRFLQSAVPGLRRTRRGNIALISALKAQTIFRQDLFNAVMQAHRDGRSADETRAIISEVHSRHLTELEQTMGQVYNVLGLQGDNNNANASGVTSTASGVTSTKLAAINDALERD